MVGGLALLRVLVLGCCGCGGFRGDVVFVCCGVVCVGWIAVVIWGFLGVGLCGLLCVWAGFVGWLFSGCRVLCSGDFLMVVC